MKRRILLCWAGLFLIFFQSPVWAAADNADTPASSTSRIVEEKTTIESRRVYENSKPKDPSARKTAIFVDNRAGPQLNDKVLVFEDQVVSRISGKNFAVISREDVLKAVKTYRGADVAVSSAVVESSHSRNDGPASSTRIAQTAAASVAISDAERNTLGTKLDQSLTDSSSALRLAQNMGADFILFVTLGSYARETKNFNDPSIGVSVKNLLYNLRGTYKVVEGVTGSSLGGDAFRSSKTIRQTETLQVDNADIINELIEDAAGKIADGLAAKASNFTPATTPGKVEIAISCGVKDLQGNEISLPDIRLNENNTITKGDKDIPVQASATIEVDGFAMGTTPARIKVAPGAHKLRLSRAGFEPIELHIAAADGLTLSPTMQMDAEGFRRWQEIRAFLNALDRDRKITDARAEEIRGNAQRLRQSGILVDFRVNTTNAPTIVRKNSIFGQDNF